MKVNRYTTLLFFALPALALAQSSTIFFNEFRADGAGADSNEFIEIIAPAGTNLANHFMVHYNGADPSDGEIWRFTFSSFTVPNDGITDTNGVPLGFVVIAQGTSVTNKDFTLPNTLQNGPDGIILYNPQSNILDAVAWGGAGDLAVDDPGTVVTTGSPSANIFLHVTGNEDNTDNSVRAPNNVRGDTGGGWTLGGATPGTINPGQTSGFIVVTSQGGGAPSNQPPTLSVPVSQTVVVSNLLKFGVSATEPDGNLITLIASNLPANSSFIPTNGTAFASGTFSFTPSAVQSGQIYTVYFRATDTNGFDQKTVNIQVLGPGDLPPPPIAFFNEVRADGAGTDTNEFIELVAPAGVNLQNFYVVHYNGSDSSDGEEFRFTFPSFIVPNDGITSTDGRNLGFAVIAMTGVANSDFTLPADMQNGPDGLVLYDAGGVVVDAVAWEGAGDMTVDDPGTVVTTGSTFSANYLSVTKDDNTGDDSLQNTNRVAGQSGAGWELGPATPGVINFLQNSGQINIITNPPPPFSTNAHMSLAGDFNAFAIKSNMALIADNLWRITTTNINVGVTNRFKFVANSTYALQWGETNQNVFELPISLTADSAPGLGNDIRVIDNLSGFTEFTFNDQTLGYSILRSVPQAMAVAGNFNDWNPAPNMTLGSGSVWQTEFAFNNATSTEFKFAANGTFAVNWGETNQTDFDIPLAGTAEAAGQNIVIPGPLNGTYTFNFNHQTLEFQVLQTPNTPVTFFQDFDSWGDAQNYGTYTFEGWTIADGLVDSQNALEGLVGRLRNTAPSADSHYIRSPSNSVGLGSLSFWYRHWNGQGAAQTLKVQKSANGANGTWADVSTITNVLSTNYVQFSLALNDLANHFVRIKKSAGSERVLVDDIFFTSDTNTAAVSISQVTIQPSSPYTNDPVTVAATVASLFSASDLQVDLYYRIGPNTNNPFTVIGMSPVGNRYTAINPIPAQPAGTVVYYYIHVEFDGPGAQNTSPTTFPPNSNPTFYGIPRNRPGSVWINEIDSVNFLDTNFFLVNGEFVELAGRNGIDISGWSLEFLDGEDTSFQVFDFYAISNATVLPNDTGNGFGFWVLGGTDVAGRDMTFTNHMSDHDPGGVRLRNEFGGIEQSVSYGAGIAGYQYPGMNDPDPDSNLVSVISVGLAGSGSTFSNFTWSTNQTTPGQVNAGQSFGLFPEMSCSNLTLTCTSQVPAATSFVGINATGTCGNLTVMLSFIPPEISNGGSGCPTNPLQIFRTYRAVSDCATTSECVQTITVSDNIAPLISLSFPPDLLNAGFETGTAGTSTITNWSSQGTNHTLQSTQPHSGGKHLRLSGSAAGSVNTNAVYQGLEAASGQTWQASAYLLIPTNNLITSSNQASVNLEFYAATGLLQRIQSPLLTSGTPAGGYLPYSATGVAPAGTITARLTVAYIQFGSNGGSVFADDTRLSALTFNSNSNCQFALPNLGPFVGGSEGCGGNMVFSQSPTSSTDLVSGDTLVTLSLRDPCGNLASRVVTVRVFDAESPSIVCPAAMTVECNADAQDNASNGAYLNDGWQTGDDGGSGWAAGWTLAVNGVGVKGHFVGDSRGNGDGSDSNGDGDVNTAGIKAWGLFANSGGLAEAFRPFGQPLRKGNAFSIQMDNGLVTAGGGRAVGFALQNNASGSTLLEILQIGTNDTYSLQDSLGFRNSGLATTDEGIQAQIVLTATNTYRALLRRLLDDVSVTVTGIFIGGSGRAADRVRIFNFDAGSGSAYDAYFNRMAVDHVPPADELLVSTSDGCGAVNIVHQGDSTNGSCLQLITRTYRATDESGNSAECSQLITVQDTTPPSFIVASSNLFYVSTTNCLILPNVTTNLTALDACGIVSLAQSPPTGTVVCAGTNGIDVLATDSCGNTSTTRLNVIVTDVLPPQSVICQLVNSNTLANASFDQGGGGGSQVISNWTIFGNAFQESFTPRSGPFHAKVFGNFQTNVNFSGVFQEQLAVPGQNWRGLVYALNPGSDYIRPGNEAFLKLEFYNGGHQFLSASDSRHLTSTAPSNSYIQLSLSAFAPAAAAYVRLVCIYQQASNAFGSVYFDDARLEPVATSLAVKQASLVPGTNLTLISVIDNCDWFPAITYQGQSGNGGAGVGGNPLILTRTIRATDDYGNFTECQQVITVDSSITNAPANVAVKSISAGPPILVTAAGTNTWLPTPQYSTNMLTNPQQWLPVTDYRNLYTSGTNMLLFNLPTNASPVYIRILNTGP